MNHKLAPSSDDWRQRLLSGEARVSVEGAVATVQQGERGVLLQYGRGEYYGLDAVACLIWDSLRSRVPVPLIVREVVERYDIGYEEAAADIATFVSDLLSRDLVRIDA